ncbi:Mitochondrial carrier protein RIM2 [Penicillium chermesinum]|nr:Mitochondrial carrier protein RIM2 [Penicillium chermesinum]
MQQGHKMHSEHVQQSVPSRVSHAPPKKAVDPLVHLLAGAIGGFATAIVTSPLDPKAGGHLFRGLGPSLAGVVPASAIKFYVYGNCKRLGAHVLSLPDDSTIVHAQAAIIGGFATATATNPIWLVKTRLQLDRAQSTTGTRRYRNSLDCVQQVLRQEGIRGLYRGLSASYLGSAETALHLVLYERLKTILAKSLGSPDGKDTATQKEITSWISTTGAAGSAKFAAALIAYPHEVIRTRLRQAPMENGRPKYTGLLQCFKLIAKEEGMAGLYGGLMPHMARSIPSAIITLGVYEFVYGFRVRREA